MRAQQLPSGSKKTASYPQSPLAPNLQILKQTIFSGVVESPRGSLESLTRVNEMREVKVEAKQTRSLFLALSLSLLLAVGLTACGGTSVVDDPAANSIGQNVPPWPGTPSGGGGSSSGGGTPQGDDPEGFVPSMVFPFSIQGNNSFETDPVETDNILRVRVTAGPAGQTVVNGDYTNYNADYSCIQYSVQVPGGYKTTGILSPYQGSPWCPDAPTDVVLDFSAQTGSPDGIPITVSFAKTDYLCLLCYTTNYSTLFFNPNYCSGVGLLYDAFSGASCAMDTVYQNHVVTGTLEVMVNGAGI